MGYPAIGSAKVSSSWWEPSSAKRFSSPSDTHTSVPRTGRSSTLEVSGSSESGLHSRQEAEPSTSPPVTMRMLLAPPTPRSPSVY